MKTKLLTINNDGQFSHSHLCISNILLKNSDGSEKNLANISKITSRSCKLNNIQLISGSIFEQLFPYFEEIKTVTRILRWIVKNNDQIQLKGVKNLIIDTLHDARPHESPEIINLLKIIRSLGIEILIFDDKNHPIKIGSVDDLIPPIDHIIIVVNSLISKIDSCNSKSNFLHEPESDCHVFEHDFDNSAVIRIPVWLDVQPDGRMLVVAKNIVSNNKLLKFAKGSIAIETQ